MQGFLLLNKPQGITSFGAVARIRKLTHERRVGHTGTLDPMATGVLPIFIGKATALSSHLSDAEKTYNATVKLGITTDTYDITGEVQSQCEVSVTMDDISAVLDEFRGKIMQTPPIFSAISQNGIRMYELARRGETAEIPERQIEIFDISVTSPLNDKGEFSFSATVSKGTYIRSLANDIGKKLGCGGVLSSLTRTNASGFDIKNAVNLDDLTEENISSYIVKEDLSLPHLCSVNVSEKQAIRFSNGGRLSLERIKNQQLKEGQLAKVYCGDVFLGLGFADLKNNQLCIKCNINKI